MIEINSKRLIKGRVQDSKNPAINARYKLADIFCQAWLSHAVTAVVKHKIADLINEKPLHINTLSDLSSLHKPSLYRVMRALAANGIFVESRPGEFVHNEISLLLRSQHQESWAAMALMWNHSICLSAWQNFSQSLSDGRSGVEHATGKSLYPALNETPGATEAFAKAMISNSVQASHAIAGAFPFSNFKKVMDLAGGVGTLLVSILAQHPSLTGMLFEIVELEEAAQEYLQAYNLQERAQFVTGDFLTSIPGGCDLYMIKNSLWNWDDNKASDILKNVREAIGDDIKSRFLIIEYIIDKENAEWTTLYDLQILNMPGGRARTRAEYTELINRAGFALEEVMYVQDQTILVSAPI